MMPLTAETILETNVKDAATLVAKDTADLPKALKKLAGTWHPDLCDDPRAGEVFDHLIQLADQVKAGLVKASVVRILKTHDGRELGVDPLRSYSVDQGELLICARTVATIFPAGCADLAEREAKVSSLFRFASKGMRQQFATALPCVMKDVELADGRRLVVAARDPEEVLLADVLAVQGAMPEKHAAWVCTSLLNIATYLTYGGLVHGAISPETVFVNPRTHAVHLATGWCFATKAGTRPAALPGRTLELVPRLAVKGQVADPDVDLQLIRQTVREALSDPRGTAGAVRALPRPIADWLTLPPAETALEDFQAWETARDASWGPRRFLVYPVTAEDIYARVT